MIKLNKKGFTLIELIVTIAIIGIISIMAMPQVTKIQEENKKKKYETYGDALIAAAKLYTDSYSRDMFAESECYAIAFDELQKKGLIRDINIERTTCNDIETYVIVNKNNGNYEYELSIKCTQNATEVYKKTPTTSCSY